MLRTFLDAPSFDATHEDTSPACRCAQRAPSSWPNALQKMYGALREALAAHRQYEHLRNSGIPHDAAAREALGFGSAPVREMRDAVERICFAGKA
jgi:hypothetical protein